MWVVAYLKMLNLKKLSKYGGKIQCRYTNTYVKRGESHEKIANYGEKDF